MKEQCVGLGIVASCIGLVSLLIIAIGTNSPGNAHHQYRWSFAENPSERDRAQRLPTPRGASRRGMTAPSVPIPQRTPDRPAITQKAVHGAEGGQTPTPGVLAPSYVKRRTDGSKSEAFRCHLKVEGKESDGDDSEVFSHVGHSCGHTATVHCPGVAGKKAPVGLLKGRALVLYMLHAVDGMEADKMPEWDNVEMMLAHGVLPAEQSTALFDGVDYVFYRIAPASQEISLCGSWKNLKFLWVPPGPCDLCGHARVLSYFGYTANSTMPDWPYRSIVLMNSGIRGPFLNDLSSAWIDIASMAGQPSRPRYGIDDDTYFRVAASSLMSWEYHPHPQSYFLILPNAALQTLFPILSQTCTQTGKLSCIFSGELILGKVLLAAGFGLHVFGFNATLTNTSVANENRVRRKHSIETALNPSFRYHHPCRTIYTKFGGDLWREKLLSHETMRAMRMFTTQFALTRPSYGVDYGFLEEQSCEIFQ